MVAERRGGVQSARPLRHGRACPGHLVEAGTARPWSGSPGQPRWRRAEYASRACPHRFNFQTANPPPPVSFPAAVEHQATRAGCFWRTSGRTGRQGPRHRARRRKRRGLTRRAAPPHFRRGVISRPTLPGPASGDADQTPLGHPRRAGASPARLAAGRRGRAGAAGSDTGSFDCSFQVGQVTACRNTDGGDRFAPFLPDGRRTGSPAKAYMSALKW